MKLLRHYAAPHQINVFFQPVENGDLGMNQYFYDPHKPTSPQQYSDMVRSVAMYSNFENAEPTTAHGPREYVSDLMGYYGVTLGMISIFLFYLTYYLSLF